MNIQNSLPFHPRLRQVDIKSEHFERQLTRTTEEKDQYERKYEVSIICWIWTALLRVLDWGVGRCYGNAPVTAESRFDIQIIVTSASLRWERDRDGPSNHVSRIIVLVRVDGIAA